MGEVVQEGCGGGAAGPVPLTPGAGGGGAGVITRELLWRGVENRSVRSP